MSVEASLRRAARELALAVDGLSFAAPVTHVYNPLDYAWRAHSEYLRRFGDSRKRVVYLGMNPGPFGMAQTGIPFGDVAFVRDWLGIEAAIARPAREHPKRPIQGFACKRSEVSGARLWGAIAAHYGKPDAFFRSSLVLNYCPLVFMEATGRNRTPDQLPRREQEPLFALCDRHLQRVLRRLEPEWVIGVGAFAACRARAAVADLPVRVGQIHHPSPASPRANQGWASLVREELGALGVCS